MSMNTLKKVLAPLALLGLSVGAYFLVLSGNIPLPHPLPRDGGVILFAIVGLTTVGAASIRAKIPAITAGVATLGFGLGVTMSGFVVTVAAALTIFGGLGFLISTLHVIGTRASNASPA